ncbi:cell division protein FtsX [Sinobacterium caligoides]|uniref:Cell division protein FtsX n=1 Tax=Sinobacterium caligoides TaxID=933926 RepID=A0A3N2DGL7_9GAMM|nr:permease-like cell division protein FtsX [Sinobacterium caligoides]ROR98943.1 cell division protein FtsX [Sinobacterium caligoides]
MADGNNRARGAQSSHVGLADLFRAWVDNHKKVVRDSIQRLLDSPLSTLLTWVVIAIALALPMTLYIALSNIQGLSIGLDGSAQVSIYLKQDVTPQAGEKLAAKLPLRKDIRAAHYISKQQALAEFRALSGFGEAIDALNENPLPAVIVVQPAPSVVQSGKAKDLLASLADLPEVDLAQLDLEWVQRLYSMMDIVERVVNALSILLGLGVLSVIGNTIRLTIESRRDEIVVAKLVGATDTFVRRPFLYTGMLYGLGGAFCSWCIVFATLWWLSGPVLALADLYHSNFQLRGLDLIDTLLLLLGGSMLGWVGAWLAVSRHLGSIEPK